MKIVLQRVKQARVQVEGASVGGIERGLLIVLGIARDDSHADADYLSDKIINLRIFPDEERRMNRSVKEIQGALLVVSQFTLCADCSKGRRPSFDAAAPPDMARAVYEYFFCKLRLSNLMVETRVFQAQM